MSKLGKKLIAAAKEAASSARRNGLEMENTNPCVCGHAIEEHGHDKKHPGSTACNECGCIAYEADESHA